MALRETAPPPNRAAILLPWDKSAARNHATLRSPEARLAEAVGLAA
jgi:GTP-binding protein HflX